MAVIETTKLFDEYFKDKNPETVKKTRSQVDRHEVYEYEAKIGKQLVDMNSDELFDMIGTFRNNRKNNSEGSYGINYNSYFQISSSYRAIFNFYIENYEVIRNPWNEKKMRGVCATERLAQKNKPFTWEIVDTAIKRVHEAYDADKAKYIECIIRLYYEGFAKAEEIVNLKEDMINFKTKEIRLPGRIVTLSDRCFMLLNYVHNMTMLEGGRYDYLMRSYHDGYFKYAIRKKDEDSFNDRTEREIANMINKRIITDVKNRFSVNVSYRDLYLLGFYDCLVATYGEERTRELILSVRNSDDVKDLMASAKKYGIVLDNVSHLKRSLRPFI